MHVRGEALIGAQVDEKDTALENAKLVDGAIKLAGSDAVVSTKSRL